MDQLDHNSNSETPNLLKRMKQKNSGYQIPKDYFAKMQTNVLSQVIEPDVAKNISWFERLQVLLQYKYQFATVAAAVLVGFMLLNNPATTSIEGQYVFSDLEENDLEYYLENDLDSWNNQDLMAVLSEDEIDIADFSIPISSEELLNDLPDQYIEELEDDSLQDFNIED